VTPEPPKTNSSEEKPNGAKDAGPNPNSTEEKRDVALLDQQLADSLETFQRLFAVYLAAAAVETVLKKHSQPEIAEQVHTVAMQIVDLYVPN